MAKLDEQLHRLATLPPVELRAAWAEQHGSEAPRLPVALLARGLVYRLQEERAGVIVPRFDGHR